MRIQSVNRRDFHTKSNDKFQIVWLIATPSVALNRIASANRHGPVACESTRNESDETSPATLNIEWARYLTSIDDIVSDTNGGEHAMSLDALCASLANPLQIDTDDLQNRFIHRFNLADYLELADGLPPPTPRRKHNASDDCPQPVNRHNASLYLIPLSDAATRYDPFDMCKQFVEQMRTHSRHLQKLLDEPRRKA